MKALRKSTDICMQAIYRLPPKLIDIATRLNIFGVYVQPHFIGCFAALAFAPKTTLTEFCTHFMSTLKKVAGFLKHATFREFLIALNKIHPLDRIQNVYKSIYTKLEEWKLIDEQQIFAERVEEAFHLLFPNQEIIEEATNTYTKYIFRLEANAVFPFEAQDKRINNIPQLPLAT